VAQKGLSLNDAVVAEGTTLEAADFFHGCWAMVRRGKKQRFVLRSTV
jgi:hypothetical protein